MTELRTEIIKLIAELTDNPDVIKLLHLSVGRVFEHGMRKELSFKDMMGEHETASLFHIRDWLTSALIEQAHWLQRVDDKGRPVKLMKFSTFGQIVREADKAMHKANQRLMKIELQPSSEELFMELEDGYTLVRMLSQVALDRESAIMQHCIGHGAYDTNLDDKDSYLLSLRDQFGKPHATIEMAFVYGRYSITQIQGKQNTQPIRKYADLLLPFLNKLKPEMKPNMMWAYGCSQEGTFYSAYDLPDFFVSNDLYITTLYPDGKMPKSIEARSIVVDNHRHNGRANGPVVRLPESIKIRQDLRLFSDVEAINPHTNVPGTLQVKAGLDRIGSNCYIGRDLELGSGYTGETLPLGLAIGGTLRLEGTKIKTLPEDISIKNLEAKKSQLRSLPDHIKHYSTLELVKNSCFQWFADDVTVDKKLVISGCKLDNAPGERLKSNTNFSAEMCNIPVLPSSWELNGQATFNMCQIGVVQGWHSTHNLSFVDCHIEKFEGTIRDVNFLNLLNTTVEQLPDRISVGVTLDIRNANLAKYENCEVTCECLVVWHDDLIDIPDHWEILDGIRVYQRERFPKHGQPSLSSKYIWMTKAEHADRMAELKQRTSAPGLSAPF